MFAAISNYCKSTPSTVTNSSLPNSYTSAIGDTLALQCSAGYQTLGSLNISCAVYNATDGVWAGPTGNCSRTSLLVCVRAVRPYEYVVRTDVSFVFEHKEIELT